MAKPPKFDRHDVINLATNLYWKKGFHATSMRDLQDEIDMRPGSIYKAFGSKEGLFKETLKNYTDMGIAQIQQYRHKYNSPIKALTALVKSQVIDTQSDAPNGMCMLVKTFSELTNDNQELIDLTKVHMDEIAFEFVKLIEEAQELDEVDKTKNAEYLASHVQVQIAGLRAFAKMSNDKNRLDEMIDNIFVHYPFLTNK